MTYSNSALSTLSAEYYCPSDQGPYYSDELIGAFTDDSGSIVGTPLAIPCQFSNDSFIIPEGATQFELGTADGYALDNSGTLQIDVEESTSTPPPTFPSVDSLPEAPGSTEGTQLAVPEPSTWAMVLAGAGTLIVIRSRFKPHEL